MLILFTLKQCQFFCLSPIFLIADFAGLHHKHHTPQITNCKKLEYLCVIQKKTKNAFRYAHEYKVIIIR